MSVNVKALDHITESAQLAFWAKVVELIPEATTGDMDPGHSFKFSEACAQAVTEWVLNNCPHPKTSICQDAPILCQLCGEEI